MTPEWIEIGRGLCYAGAGLAFGLAGAGSAYGIAIASHAAAGVMREKPELFGRMLVMVALPGTQGFYGFIAAILIMTQTGLIGGGSLKITLGTGIALFFIALVLVIVFYVIERYWLSEKVEDASAETIQKIEEKLLAVEEVAQEKFHDLSERLHLTRDMNREESDEGLKQDGGAKKRRDDDKT